MLRLKFPRKYIGKYSPYIFCVLVILILYNIISVDVDWQYNSIFDYGCQKNGSEPFPHVIHYCIHGPKIFFIETSESRTLNPRQACAVESTARHNPSMSTAILMTTPDGIKSSDELIEGLRKIPNVEILTIDVDVFLYNTSLWQWYRNGVWRQSKWKVSHLSDGLRFLTVWRYGGIYLDLDIVSLRSMTHLRNSVIAQAWTSVASGILVFDKGHEILKQTIEDFSLHYRKNNFISNGPGAISRNIQRYCDVKDFGKVSGSNCNVTILPPETAFPIDWDKWEQYFEPSNITNIANYFQSSYLIHVWNKYSKEGKVVIGEGSLYEIAMKEHCPLVYAYAQKYKYV